MLCGRPPCGEPPESDCSYQAQCSTLAGSSASCRQYQRLYILTGTQLVSNAAAGTPPLAVPSATLVENLNASFLGGISAGGFAGTGANSFSASQTVAGNGLNVLIGNVGCGNPTAGITFSGSGCTNYALISDTTGTTINRPSGETIRFREGNGSDQVEIQPGGNVAVLGGAVTITSNSTAAIGLTVTSNSPSSAARAASFRKQSRHRRRVGSVPAQNPMQMHSTNVRSGDRQSKHRSRASRR